MTAQPRRILLGACVLGQTSSSSVLSKKVLLGISAILLCSVLKIEDGRKLEKRYGRA